LYAALYKWDGESSDYIELEYKYYEDAMTEPLVIKEYAAQEEFIVYVQYEWLDSPAPDYTVKVYSKHDLEIYDENLGTSVLYTDGRSPSEWTGSDYKGVPEFK